MIQIIFRKSHWNKLTSNLAERTDVESGAYAVYKMSTFNNSQKFLVTKLIIPEEKDYLKRNAVGISFTPEFTENAFQSCEKTNGHLLDIHTHPWSDNVNFSPIDDREAKHTKIPYMAKYVPSTSIAFIVFGKVAEIAKARYWKGPSVLLEDIHRILVI
ncbi:hypothetical protein HY405_00395 [Candidatus Microgenomates bacterium]|nr:hypothetical protein [Candidatus Microgenomates bacterium]